MKIQIKFLIAFSCMFLSCNPLTLCNSGKGNKEAGSNAIIKTEVGENDLRYKLMVKLKEAYEEYMQAHIIKHQECKNFLSQYVKCFIERRGLMSSNNAHNLFWSDSALQCAIIAGSGNMVKVLVQMPKIYDGLLNVSNLLDCSICYGPPEILQTLLELGVDLNLLYHSERAGQHGNAFRRAVVYNRVDVAMYMIRGDLIENWGQGDNYGHTPLMHAAGSRYPGWSKVLAALLQKKGVDIKAQDKDSSNVLIHLINRYADIYRRYYGSRNEFVAGYNLELTDDPKGEKLFSNLCRDKRDMLRFLCQCEDIQYIIRSGHGRYRQILTYAAMLLFEIAKKQTDAATEIREILASAGFGASEVQIAECSYTAEAT